MNHDLKSGSTCACTLHSKDVTVVINVVYFFFSSRRRHTRCSRDWSSDVCSSDLTGDRFRAEDHVYAEDLDLFGKGSLFELLSTARLPMGENRLADWLRRPSPKPVVLARQEFVAELRQKLDLRESVALTGESLRVRLDPASLVGWAEQPPGLPGNIGRGLAFALAAAAVAAGVYYFFSPAVWPLLLILLLEASLQRQLRKRAEAVLDGVAC